MKNLWLCGFVLFGFGIHLVSGAAQEPPAPAAPGTAPASSDEGVIADAIRAAEAAARQVKDAKNQAARTAALEALHRVGPDKALAGVSAADTLRGMNRITQRGNAFGDALLQREELRQLDAEARNPQNTADQQAIARAMAAEMRRTGLTSAQLLQARTPPTQGAGAAALGFSEPTEPPAMPSLPGVTGSKLSEGADQAPADLDDLSGAGPAGASVGRRSGALDPARAGSSPGIPGRGLAADALSADAVDGLPNPLDAPGRTADVIRSTGGANARPTAAGQSSATLPNSGNGNGPTGTAAGTAVPPLGIPSNAPLLAAPRSGDVSQTPDLDFVLGVDQLVATGVADAERQMQLRRLLELSQDRSLTRQVRSNIALLYQQARQDPSIQPAQVLDRLRTSLNADAFDAHPDPMPRSGAAADALTAGAVDPDAVRSGANPSRTGDLLGAGAGVDADGLAMPPDVAQPGGVGGTGRIPARGAGADAATADGVDPSLEDSLPHPGAAGDALGADAGTDPSRVRTPSAAADRMRAARAGLDGQTVSDDGADAIRRALAGAGPSAPADPAPPGSTQRWTIAELQSHTARMQAGAHMAVERVTAIDSRLATTRDRAERAALEAERADLASRIAWYNDQIAQNNDNLVARGAPAAALVDVSGAVAPPAPATGTGLFVNPDDPPRWDPAGLRSHNQRSYNMAMMQAEAIAALDARIAGEGRNNTPLRNQLLAERAERIAQLNGHNHDIDANNRLLAQRGLPGDAGVPAPGAAPAPALPAAAPPAAAPAPGRSVGRLQSDSWRAEQDGRAELAAIQDLDARIATEGRNNSTVRRQLQAERDQAVNRLRALNALIEDNNRDLAGQGAPVTPLLPVPGNVRAPAADDWRNGPADGDSPDAGTPGLSDLVTRINHADHLDPDKQSATGDDGGVALPPGSVGDNLVAGTASNRVMHGRTAGAHVGDANSSTTTGDPNPLGDLSQSIGALSGAITNINGAVTGVRDIRRQIQDMRHSGTGHDGGGDAAGGDPVPPAAGDPATAATDGAGGAGTGAAGHDHGPGGDTAVGRAGARTGGTVKPGNIGRAGSSTGGTVAGRTIGGGNPLPPPERHSSDSGSNVTRSGVPVEPSRPSASPPGEKPLAAPLVSTAGAGTAAPSASTRILFVQCAVSGNCYLTMLAPSEFQKYQEGRNLQVLGTFASAKEAEGWVEKNIPRDPKTGKRFHGGREVYINY